MSHYGTGYGTARRDGSPNGSPHGSAIEFGTDRVYQTTSGYASTSSTPVVSFVNVSKHLRQPEGGRRAEPGPAAR